MANHSKEQLLSKATRCWTIVFYPESMPENWLQILNNLHVQGAVSPLHSSDLNGDGSEKKEHYHLILKFDGNKRYPAIKEIADMLNAPSPDYVDNERVMVRYLVHRDNPEKAQYDIKDIVLLGDYDIDDFFSSHKDDLNLIRRIEFNIYDNHFDNMSDLYKYLRDNEMDEEINYLRNHYGWFNAILTAIWQKNHKNHYL